jgi:hypothetical protein
MVCDPDVGQGQALRRGPALRVAAPLAALLATILPAAALPGCADASDASRIVVSAPYPVDIDYGCDGRKWTAIRVGPSTPLSLWIWNDGCATNRDTRLARVVTSTAEGPIEKFYRLSFGRRYVVHFSRDDGLYVFRQMTPAEEPPSETNPVEQST